MDRVTNSCHTHTGSRSRYQRQLKRLERLGSSTVAGARTPIAEAEEEEEDEEEEEEAAMAQRRLKGKRKRKRGEGSRKGGGEKSEL